MVSVENFYHVLYEHLLKPVNFHMRYYYPFGTHQTVMHRGREECNKLLAMNLPLVLFHFDQEPIYPQDDVVIFDGTRNRHMTGKCPKMLANSERSSIKKRICAEYDLLDWYYFYHGFAALDWYRDAKYFAYNNEIDRVFLSLNHLVTGQRSYRMSLLARMLEKKLHHHGIISFHGTAQTCWNEINTAGCMISAYSRDLIARHLASRSDLPFVADRDQIDGTASAGFGHIEYDMRMNAMWSVVNETVFYDDKLHLTEKIFQPIVTNRPFLLVSSTGSLAYLKSYGFKTFGDWIDESYDSEPDPDTRMDMIIDQLDWLCARPMAQLRQMLAEMRPILEHNKNHFFDQFREIICNELVENFNQCIRVWNNGRVDDRQVMLHPNPQQVKDLLIN